MKLKKNLETDFLRLFPNLPNEFIKCFVDPFVKNLKSFNQFAKPSIDIREDEMLRAKSAEMLACLWDGVEKGALLASALWLQSNFFLADVYCYLIQGSIYEVVIKKNFV